MEHLPIARVRNLADFLADAKEAGCWCYGASAGARTSYDAPDFSGGVVLVLGAEGKGLRPRVASACDDLISLPVRGRVGSLNVSAAAAVAPVRRSCRAGLTGLHNVPSSASHKVELEG